MRTEFRKSNHFVAEHYLKRWAGADRRVWTYRILAPHANVHVWKSFPLSGVAKRNYLYTRMVAGMETDEIERWLGAEFEAPAEAALHKATTGSQMTSDDWTRLIRYLAAQDVRTPARLEEMMLRWKRNMPDLLTGVLDDAVLELEKAKRTGVPLGFRPNIPMDAYVPISVSIGKDDQGRGTLAAEMVIGRSMWLFSMRTLLQSTVRHLMLHRWTILESPPGCHWPTSDDPVIKLNYNGPGQYDFGGGWGSPGTEIIMPVGPRHLLYTRIGQRPPPRGARVAMEQYLQLRRIIAKHAHRLIFSVAADPDIEALRPRIVDLAAYLSEEEQWANWHRDQAVAEEDLR